MTENANDPFLYNLNCIKLKDNLILSNTNNLISFTESTNHNFEYTTSSGVQSLNENGYVFDGNNKTITINSIDKDFNGLFVNLNSKPICIINLNVIVNCDIGNKAVFMNNDSYLGWLQIVSCSVIVNKPVLAPFTNIKNGRVRVINSYVIINAPTKFGFIVSTDMTNGKYDISRSYIIVNDSLDYLITDTSNIEWINNVCYNHCIINNLSNRGKINYWNDKPGKYFKFYLTNDDSSFPKDSSIDSFILSSTINNNFVDLFTNPRENVSIDKLFGNFTYYGIEHKFTQYEITMDGNTYTFPGFLKRTISDYTFCRNQLYQFYLTLNYSSINTIIDDKVMQSNNLLPNYEITRTNKVYLKNICDASKISFSNNILTWKCFNSTGIVEYSVTVENDNIVLRNNITKENSNLSIVQNIINAMVNNLTDGILSIKLNKDTTISDTSDKIMSILSIYDPINKENKYNDFLSYVLNNWSTISNEILLNKTTNITLINTLSNSLNKLSDATKKDIVLNFINFLYYTPEALQETKHQNYPFNILLNCNFELKEFKNQTLTSTTTVLLSN